MTLVEEASFIQIVPFGLGKALKGQKTQWGRTYMMVSEDLKAIRQDF